MKSPKRVRNYKKKSRKSRKKMGKSGRMKGGAASLDLSIWAIDTDKGKINFSKKDSDRLTEQYLQQNFQLETDRGIYTYRIDLLNLTQKNTNTGKVRRLYLPNDDRFKWSVVTDTGIQPYDLKISYELTKKYLNREDTYEFKIGRFVYEINLIELKQINLKTGKGRSVKLPTFLSGGGGGGGASALGTSIVGVNTTRPGGNAVGSKRPGGGTAAGSKRPGGGTAAGRSKRPGGGSVASSSKRPGGGSSASRSKRPGGGTVAGSMTVTLGDGSYEPHIDALKPSFRHMDDRETLMIEYSEMEKLLSKDLRTLLEKAKKGYPWGDIGVRIPYFTKLLSKGLGGPSSQVMTIERHRFNKVEYMALQKQKFTIIPTTLPDKPTTGYFDLSSGVNPGEAISDFANKYLGGNYLGGGLVQEELMFHKTPILFLTQLDQYTKGTPITLPGYDSLVIEGAIQLWDIQMYKRFDPDWETKISERKLGPSKIVVFDALNLTNIIIGKHKVSTPMYLKREVIWHIIKYYNTFDGAVKSGIKKLHSGSIGAGVFGHTHAASFLMQMFALCLVNIKHRGPVLTLVLHTDPSGRTKRLQEQAYANSMRILGTLNNKVTIEQALTEIIRIITTNEGGLYTVKRTR